jgi:hypothetical protein
VSDWRFTLDDIVMVAVVSLIEAFACDNCRAVVVCGSACGCGFVYVERAGLSGSRVVDISVGLVLFLVGQV